MHDYFEILGLPTNARASEIRRACARRVHLAHPDFRASPGVAPVPVDRALTDAPGVDVAIDFLDAAALVERMQAAFFATR